MILIFQIVSLFVSCKMLELFEEYYEEAEKFLSKMTLEQKLDKCSSLNLQMIQKMML